MPLRKGRTKNTLESSFETALLALEVYNRPRTSFRVENYIILMVIAWTKLFHAHFQNTIGEKYYYKERNGRYKIVDGEKKSWGLSDCIKACPFLTPPVRANLQFFIGLRNKIEHRHIENNTFDSSIFGECQSLLYNYENMILEFFGEEYSINESLVYSLQFANMRTTEQQISNKSLLSKEMQDLKKYVEKYRSMLTQDIFDSMEYSVKLIQIPKITNTNRNELAIEFVSWNNLNGEDKDSFDKLSVLIKDKLAPQRVVNLSMYKPTEVIKKVHERSGIQISMSQHTLLWKIFNVRPATNSDEKFETNQRYCCFDEPHCDYVYTQDWINFICTLFEKHDFTFSNPKLKCSGTLNITDYE